MKLHSFTLPEQVPHKLFASLSDQPYSLFFDSADPQHELNRYSFIMFHPIETVEAKNGLITVTNSEQQLTFEGSPFEIVKGRLEDYGLEKNCRNDYPPFQGGAAGFFGYDLARNIEKLPQTSEDNPAMPDMAVGIYDQAFVYDHHQKTASFMVHARSDENAKAKYNHFLKLVHAPRNVTARHHGESQWYGSHTKQAYERAVQKVIDYIHAGDIFQANLSQQFEAKLPAGFDAWIHYETLREVNPAPFSGFMNFGNVKLASASPERFLSLQRDRKAETRPIKGTAPRHEDDAVDQLFRNSLENSEKDRAENTMIVDLLRNDLSKVCEDHSIEVPKLCALESFARVHHLVSVVRGTLRADQSAVDLLRACFPGGSITGAPKVRAMEIIEELEQKRRGPYCGAIGYIGFDGAMDTSIAIRTLVYEGNKVSFNVGGGIVADSKPEAEYQETMNKAEAIFASFEKYAERLPIQEQEAV